MGLFSKDDDMKKVGEDMQNLSNQIADLQKKLAGKTAEADSLRTQAAQASGSSVALEDAQSEIAVLRQQIADMKAQAEAATAPVAKVLSDISSSSAATEGAKAIGGLIAGAQAWVTRAGGLPLRMRSAPSLSGEVLDRLAPGTELTLLDGPQQADGHGWWHVRTAGGEGWVAGEELRTQPD
ncbi:MAG: SH3 domain-containing protein [Chloroflexi bacterium SZAS-1]|jgi:hypothetical protein|nr:SH3 domain-containing protein [Chloroflexi bacterium SZAS-1]HNP85419.1 SH3 domain-containing protein [Kouleothrix sp.]